MKSAAAGSGGGRWVPKGQPFFLHALAQTARKMGEEDADVLDTGEDNHCDGRMVGYNYVFPSGSVGLPAESRKLESAEENAPSLGRKKLQEVKTVVLDKVVTSLKVHSVLPTLGYMLQAARRHSRDQVVILLRQLQWFLRILFEIQQFSDSLEQLTDILEDAGCAHLPVYRHLNVTRASLLQFLRMTQCAIACTERRLEDLLLPR
eukprot:s3665_g6.t2